MIKSDLVKKMAEKSGLTQVDAEKALDAFMDSVVEAMKAGEEVKLVGFGQFYIKTTKERRGRNPATKEEIVIPAKKPVKLKLGALLRKATEGK